MKLKYILPLFLLTMFTGCLSQEDILEHVTGGAVDIPVGDYVSECKINGSDSSTIHLAVSSSPAQRTIVIEAFTGVTDCSGSGVPGDADVATFELANLNFGNNTSYLTEDSPTTGVTNTPYHVDGTDLYFGVDVDGIISGGSPASLFSAFIADPVNTADTKFMKLRP